MTSPIISVIIPTYNRAKLLERAILSVFKQTHPEIEIVVSDNCSTDHTEECVNKLREKSVIPFIYSKNTQNLGMVGNWDYALKYLSNGAYAIILSDDDYLIDPDYLAKAISAIKIHNPCLVFSRCTIVDSDTGTEIKHQTQSQRDVKFNPVVSTKEIISTWGCHGNGPGLGFSIMLQTAIFNRSIVINKFGGFSQNILSIDYKTWWSIMALNLPICFIDTMGAAYAVHHSNETKRHPPTIEQLVENFDCFLGVNLLSNPTLDKTFVDANVGRIIKDNLSGWPGHYVTVYSFWKAYKALNTKDKRLSQTFLSFLTKPRYLLKFILTLIPGLFPYISKRHQKSKLSKAVNAQRLSTR